MLNLITLSAKAPDMGGAAENLKEYGGNVTLSGLIIVFAMLILLVVVIASFGAVMDRLNGTKKPKSPTVKKEAPKPANVEETPKSMQNSTEDESVIAAISAAVMMMYEGTGKRPVIRSIKPAASSRSAWKQAGVLNNVRSF